MVKHLPVPKWFNSLRAKFQAKAEKVATAIEQKFCDHWWMKETVWVHSSDPAKRTVASRKATCIRCGHSEAVESWRNFPVNTRSNAECRRIAESLKVTP